MVRMSASPSPASATASSFEEKNLLLLDTGAEASCCGGGHCGTGIVIAEDTAETPDGGAAAGSDRRSRDAD